jgi:hypothetical protein
MSEVLLFNNDDARPYPSVHTIEAIIKFGWTVLPYILCSPDLTPLYFHLFDCPMQVQEWALGGEGGKPCVNTITETTRHCRMPYFTAGR